MVVTTEAHANRIRLEVSYPGPVFVGTTWDYLNPTAAGRGLAIIAAIADRWGIIQSEGMVVWFEIDQHPHRRASAEEETDLGLSAVCLSTDLLDDRVEDQSRD